MPELPAVERARRLAQRVARGRRITKVVCARDPIVFDGAGPLRMRNALTGRTVRAARRWGKHIWLELDRRPWPCFHFGMTGSFRVRGVPPLHLVMSPATAGAQWPPRFTKIRLWLTGGRELVMTNTRRLGRIRLRHDPPHEPPISELGFDPLLDLPPAGRIGALLARRAAPIKAVLLDQSFAAGVGNWIADEVLYQSRIDPRRRACALERHEVSRLRSRLKLVIETAVAADAVSARFPKRWLFHHRWGKDSDAVTARGEWIEHITIAGRTTAWVPEVQC
ncbi:MAG: DNA-formamidopyrimidine glycosylase family protein [Planctomycetota bacterium]|jgi:formamidopyrimidine-DNA glycosylase